jgi:hypothetical protein
METGRKIVNDCGSAHYVESKFKAQNGEAAVGEKIPRLSSSWNPTLQKTNDGAPGFLERRPRPRRRI